MCIYKDEKVLINPFFLKFSIVNRFVVILSVLFFFFSFFYFFIFFFLLVQRALGVARDMKCQKISSHRRLSLLPRILKVIFCDRLPPADFIIKRSVEKAAAMDPVMAMDLACGEMAPASTDSAPAIFPFASFLQIQIPSTPRGSGVETALMT